MKKSLVILFLLSISLTSLFLYSCKKDKGTFSITTPVNSSEFSITLEEGGQQVKDGEFSATGGSNVKFKLTLNDKYNRNVVVVKNKGEKLTLSNGSTTNVAYFTLSNITANAEITVENLQVKKLAIFIAYQKNADGSILNGNQEYLRLGIHSREHYNPVSTVISLSNQRRIEVEYGEPLSIYVKTTRQQIFAIYTLELSHSSDSYSGTEQAGTIPALTVSQTKYADEYLFSLPTVTQSTTIYIDSTNMRKGLHTTIKPPVNETISVEASKSNKTWGESFSFSVTKLQPSKPEIYTNMEVWVNDRKIESPNANGQYIIPSDTTPADVTDPDSEFDNTKFCIHIKNLYLERDDTESLVNIKFVRDTIPIEEDPDARIFDFDERLNIPYAVKNGNTDVFIFPNNTSADYTVASYQFRVGFDYQPFSELEFWDEEESSKIDLFSPNSRRWSSDFCISFTRSKVDSEYLYKIEIKKTRSSQAEELTIYLKLPLFTLSHHLFRIYNPKAPLYNMYAYTASNPEPLLITNTTSEQARNQDAFKVLWMDTLYIEIRRKPGHTISLANFDLSWSYNTPTIEVFPDDHGIYKKLYSWEVNDFSQWTNTGGTEIWGT